MARLLSYSPRWAAFSATITQPTNSGSRSPQPRTKRSSATDAAAQPTSDVWVPSPVVSARVLDATYICMFAWDCSRLSNKPQTRSYTKSNQL
ncbi:hypothetical protein CALCODRAFT_491164 [Calocera cornea HHB12733]|uniref:Uncharacterized protein n=1 Tax=Calocera cornea HHB12733 TaxID=1353952 RepID=A0A165JB73_9BASI|nr:hypothetical protein CALCODRAFT_491164 [Calocera cornea HHB12733]